MKMFLFWALGVVCDAHVVVVDADGLGGRPQLGLHLREVGQRVQVAVAGDDEGAVVVEGRVAAAPDHKGPVGVREGHPAPDLNL